jgi:ABC-2 type transport system permease protein
MAFFLSTVTDTPAGPIGAGIGIAILSQILDGIPGVGIVRNGLPTHYWDAWRRLFIPGFPLGDIGRGLLVDLGYLVAFLALSAWWFARKDVLS